MTQAYYSVVLDHPADQVWAVIRDFGHYGWAGVEGETIVEGGKAGDQGGAVRRFTSGDTTLRQCLLAHSDICRSYTYRFCDPAPFPVQDYTATLRVAPITADGKSFVEWLAHFDSPIEERIRWSEHFERGFATWLAALGRFMTGVGGSNRPATGD